MPAVSEPTASEPTASEPTASEPTACQSAVFADPLSPASDPPADPGRPRRRWEAWRSPAGQPAWARPVLLAIAALAAALYAWNIADAGLAPFYSVAVKSMSESWKAFFYGAFDPQATITIDKLAGSFLPQALSARIFGFHPWSLALPQVIEGVVSVLVMYRVVRRWAGAVPGILAALIFALTPIAASMFGHSMEDGALTMCLVLAADAYQRSIAERRLRSLLWAGFWVGVGFQAKMLQAWMVLPALVVGYLACASGPLRRRVWHLAVFGVVTAIVSLSWILLYTFTPAADRPYVDGSTNNSAWSMVFGYNGLERFGISVPGAVDSGPGVTTGGGAGGLASTAPASTAPAGTSPVGAGAAVSGSGGLSRGVAGAGHFGGGGGFGTGWTKLLGSEFGPQIGWLYPLALLALICGLVWLRRARRDDQVRGGFVFWGVWLLTFGFIFSDMSSIPHTAYVASLAPAVAALSAAGIVMFWRSHRAGERRGWMLPVAVAACLAWAIFLWRSYSGFLPWAPWAAMAVGILALAVMIAARLSRRMRARLVTVALVAGVAAMLAAPATWAASVLDAKYAGSSFNAGAGPDSGMGGGAGGFGGGHPEAAGRFRFADGGAATGATGFGAPGRTSGGAPGSGFGSGTGSDRSGYPSRGGGDRQAGTGTGTGTGRSFTPPGGASGTGGTGGIAGMMGATQSLTASEREIYDYVSAHRDGASYLMAVESWSEASPYILSTGQEVMPMGGFSGSVPSPTLARVQELVKSGQLRFFLLSGTTGTASGRAGGSAGLGLGRGGSGTTAASIESWVKQTCTAVPAKDYGGTTSSNSSTSSNGSTSSNSPAGAGAGTSAETLYECQS